MKCDIIIPVWNQLKETRLCIESIIKNTIYPYRLIIIDNGSSPDTATYLEGLKHCISEYVLIRNETNLGFVKAINQGLKHSSASYICILNNDTQPGTLWLTELVRFAEEHPDIGLLNPLCKGHIEHGMSVNEYARYVSHVNKNRYMEMNQCQGYCMLIKREVLDKIGYFDERFGLGGFDDTDYSMRAHLAGYRCVCVYTSYVFHAEHTSFRSMGNRKVIQSKSEIEYFRKWPRHIRIGIGYTIDSDTPKEEIEFFLKTALFLAREWCWVNLWIFGKRNARCRISNISDTIHIPLHQNIKYNFLGSFKHCQIFIRIVERMYGAKRRKKYDFVLLDDARIVKFLRTIPIFCREEIHYIDFKDDPTAELKDMLFKKRNSECINQSAI